MECEFCNLFSTQSTDVNIRRSDSWKQVTGLFEHALCARLEVDLLDGLLVLVLFVEEGQYSRVHVVEGLLAYLELPLFNEGNSVRLGPLGEDYLACLCDSLQLQVVADLDERVLSQRVEECKLLQERYHLLLVALF